MDPGLGLGFRASNMLPVQLNATIERHHTENQVLDPLSYRSFCKFWISCLVPLVPLLKLSCEDMQGPQSLKVAHPMGKIKIFRLSRMTLLAGG